jgi:hypothetical protein
MGKNVSENKNFREISTTGKKIMIESGSGNYVFEYAEE